MFIEVVNILLLDSKGRILLQKRSPSKNHNPALLDKSIGGHVVCGDNPTLTVMAETLQELGMAAYVGANPHDFAKILDLLRSQTNVVSIVLPVDTLDLRSSKIIAGENVAIGNRVHLFFGIYDGPINFADSEVSGVQYMELEDLDRQIEATPGVFTQDLINLVSKYKERILRFRDQYRK